MKYCFILLSHLFCVMTCLGQEDNCKVLLKDALQKIRSSTSDGYHMDYEITTEFSIDEGTERYSSRAMVIVNGDKSIFKSEELEIFKDQRNMITVNKEEKVIYISNAVGTDWKKIQAEALAILHDTLVSKITVMSCETSCPERADEHFTDKIEIALPATYKRMLGINAMTYWIDRDSQQIVRCAVAYQNHPMGINSIDFTIYKYTSAYAGVAYQGDAISKIMTRDNKLMGRYKGYTVRDLR